jgi:CPA1 family monovalent cation:H+ antiporter
VQHELAEGQPDADLYADAAVRLMDLYRERIEGRSQTGDAAALVKRIDGVERKLRLAALRAERDEIFRTARARQIEDDIARKLVREIDLLEARYV